MATLSYEAVQLIPGAECVNIPSYVVTFPATTARKTFFGTPTGPTQPSLFRYKIQDTRILFTNSGPSKGIQR